MKLGSTIPFSKLPSAKSSDNQSVKWSLKAKSKIHESNLHKDLWSYLMYYELTTIIYPYQFKQNYNSHLKYYSILE